MRKFIKRLGVVLVVCWMVGVLGSWLPADTRTAEDPAFTSIKTCAQNQERIQHATADDHKAALLWWCMRKHYGLNR